MCFNNHLIYFPRYFLFSLYLSHYSYSQKMWIICQIWIEAIGVLEEFASVESAIIVTILLNFLKIDKKKMYENAQFVLPILRGWFKAFLPRNVIAAFGRILISGKVSACLYITKKKKFQSCSHHLLPGQQSLYNWKPPITHSSSTEVEKIVNSSALLDWTMQRKRHFSF